MRKETIVCEDQLDETGKGFVVGNLATDVGDFSLTRRWSGARLHQFGEEDNPFLLISRYRELR
jgi:hypothetical protein